MVDKVVYQDSLGHAIWIVVIQETREGSYQFGLSESFGKKCNS